MIIKTKFKDLFIFQNKSYKDKRGYFKEILIEKKIKKRFPFKVMSYSGKNVIRGLHIQTKKPQAKIVTVLKDNAYRKEYIPIQGLEKLRHAISKEEYFPSSAFNLYICICIQAWLSGLSLEWDLYKGRWDPPPKEHKSK